MYFTTNGSCTLIIGKLNFFQAKPTYHIEWKILTGNMFPCMNYISKQTNSDRFERSITDNFFCKCYWNWNSLCYSFSCVRKKECFKYDFLNEQKVIGILRVFEKEILWSVLCIQSRKKFHSQLLENVVNYSYTFKNVDMN